MSHIEENSWTHRPKYFGYESVFNAHECYNKVLCKETVGIYPWSRASLHTHIVYSCHTPLLILILQTVRHVFSLQLLFTYIRFFSFVSFGLRSSFNTRSISDGTERVKSCRCSLPFIIVWLCMRAVRHLTFICRGRRSGVAIFRFYLFNFLLWLPVFYVTFVQLLRC